MDCHLCTCRATQLRSGLLFSLLLLMIPADLALPAQRHPPVVLGEIGLRWGGEWVLQGPFAARVCWANFSVVHLLLSTKPRAFGI